MVKILGLCLFVMFFQGASAKNTYSGTVTDLLSGQPVGQAEIGIKGTGLTTVANEFGEFRITENEDSLTDGEIKIEARKVYWNIPNSGILTIYSITGQKVSSFKMQVGEGEAALNQLADGIYILQVLFTSGESLNTKFFYSHLIRTGITTLKSSARNYDVQSDTLVISRQGYYTQEYALSEIYSQYDLMPVSVTRAVDYVHSLIRQETFTLMEGLPLNPVFSEIKTVKILYSVNNDEIYYTNSSKFNIHYEFARDVLGYNKGHATFNQEQYTNNANRLYILASLNHFTASDMYTLDFFAGDELECSQILKVYNKVVQTTYVGTKLRFYANNLTWSGCDSIPAITAEELFAGQNYQPLNPGEAFGYLKKFTVQELRNEYAGRHDIILLNGIPNDITVVSGIITTEFQTPLSHINVLSHNRGAPNMALRDGWTNPQLETFNNKLVYLKVTLDTFLMREANLNEAQAFWARKEPVKVTKLRHDTITQGLFNLASANIESDTVIGGKAANFSELMKINTGPGPIPLPEGAFAIPFFYYWQHMHASSLDLFVRQMIMEERFKTDFSYRKSQLARLQDSIIAYPIDPLLLQLVTEKISETGGFTNIRFRSSTNSEDIKGFNGAGLYDSYTAIPGNPEKTIEMAIKKVWSSLWNLPAFEEREYFKIDPLSVAMAILVHRSFPSEAANGVVITKNLYNPYNPGFTINVQVGEISITNPEEGYTPDQIIWYTFDDIIEYINKSNVPALDGKTVLSNAEIKELASFCLAIHNHYCRLNSGCLPVDIEFKIDVINGTRKIYIKQARLY